MTNDNYMCLTIEKIKSLGKNKTKENFIFLLKEFENENKYKKERNGNLLRREIASSIGRYYKIYEKEVVDFINNNYKVDHVNLDIVYQFMRTALYLKNIELIEKIYKHYQQNEYLLKMIKFYFFKKDDNLCYLEQILSSEDFEKIKKEYSDVKSFIKNNRQKLNNKISILDLLKTECLKEIQDQTQKDELFVFNNENETMGIVFNGDSNEVLKNIKENSIDLIFTSPPYYNARDYSQYVSHQDYINKMNNIIEKCIKVLKPNRYIIINISPVITKRAGREFESQRLPLHIDFHNILCKNNCEFVDEIIWIKPEASVSNRNGIFQQNQMSLNYKPNNVNEYILVYKKSAPFLMDEVIKDYKNKNIDLTIKNLLEEKAENKKDFDSTNIWTIQPKNSKYHSAVFPDQLCEKIIKYYSVEKDVVLDPFSGSGTVGRVANNLNRKFLLIEQNKEYFNLIKENLMKNKNDNF